MLNFKGAYGVLRFRSLLPLHNWNRIRRISLSTVFLVPKKLSTDLFPPGRALPPENYNAWINACLTIGTLQNLQQVTIDMTIWNYHNYRTTNVIEHDDFICILQPLRSIEAPLFEVELNVEVPEPVRTALGLGTFSYQKRDRPYNSKVFRQG